MNCFDITNYSLNNIRFLLFPNGLSLDYIVVLHKTLESSYLINGKTTVGRRVSLVRSPVGRPKIR